MKLTTTNHPSEGERQRGPLFPPPQERVCAYQSESINLEFTIHGTPPERGDGKLNWDLPKNLYDRYELRIGRRTGKALHFELRGHRIDIVEQRKANGFAVEWDVLSTCLDFAELCNRLFSDGAMVFHEPESFPESVKEAMKSAYQRVGTNANPIV